MDWHTLARRLLVAVTLPVVAVLVVLGLLFSVPYIPDIFDAIKDA